MNNPGCTGASDVRTCSKRQDTSEELPGCLPQHSRLDPAAGFGLRSRNLSTTTAKPLLRIFLFNHEIGYLWFTCKQAEGVGLHRARSVLKVRLFNAQRKGTTVAFYWL